MQVIFLLLLLASPVMAAANVVRHVKIFKQNSEYLHLREVQALDANGINHALASRGAQATQWSGVGLGRGGAGMSTWVVNMI